MSENMEKPVSFRVTQQQYEQLVESAESAGCHSVSEFVRRKSLEDVSDGMRETILLIKELALSSVAHHNLECDAMGIKPEDREPLINQRKVDILKSWNDRNGIS